jgi:hypothetical protein
MMIAPASAGAIRVRVLLFWGRLIRLPFVSSCLVLLDFAGAAVDAVTINNMTRFGIPAAFRVVNFPKNKFKISIRGFFGAV